MSNSRFAKFAKALGAIIDIRPVKKSVDNHPQVNELKADYYQYGVRKTHTAIDEDFVLYGLKNALEDINIDKAKVIWNTMCASPSTVLKARFRPNRQYGLRVRPSTLVLQLKNAKWIPQGGDQFTKPADARADLLPSGFPYDVGKEWLQAVGFGSEAEKRTEEARKRKAIAAELGFDDDAALADAQKFAALDPAKRRDFLEELERKATFELPESEPKNPERRTQRVREQANEDANKLGEKRTRTVQVGIEDVKKEAEQYLRSQYTNPDGEMICQICREALPFKLSDGRFYFEKVELVRSLRKRHHQNYLSLCPNHAAMFQHVHGTAELIGELLLDCEGENLEIELAGEDAIIYFTATHLADLKAVLDVSASGS